MANPRYDRYREPSRREQQTDLALKFAGLGMEQQNLQDRAHTARVAQALQAMGLMQDQQQQQARLQQSSDVLGFQREDAQRQGQQFDARLGFDQKKLGADVAGDADRNKQALNMALLQAMQGMNVDPAVGTSFMGSLSPEFKVANETAVAQKRAAEMKALGLGPEGTPVAGATPPPQGNPLLTGVMAAQPIPQAISLGRNVSQLAGNPSTGGAIGGAAGAFGSSLASLFPEYTPPLAPAGVGGAANLNIMQLLNFLQRR